MSTAITYNKYAVGAMKRACEKLRDLRLSNRDFFFDVECKMFDRVHRKEWERAVTRAYWGLRP